MKIFGSYNLDKPNMIKGAFLAVLGMGIYVAKSFIDNDYLILKTLLGITGLVIMVIGGRMLRTHMQAKAISSEERKRQMLISWIICLVFLIYGTYIFISLMKMK